MPESLGAPCCKCGHYQNEHSFDCVFRGREPVKIIPPQGGSGTAPAETFRGILAGVGKDAPVIANEKGGKQSLTPYRCDLLPPRATLAVAEVLDHGARKYGSNNWHSIPVADHINHAMVHLFAFLSGDTQDDHLEHGACRLLMALEQKLTGR